MTRKEVYAKIDQMNLRNTVLTETGKNFTLVSTAKLEEIIALHSTAAPAPVEKAKTIEAKPVAEPVDAYEAACIAFVGILKDSGKLDGILSKL